MKFWVYLRKILSTRITLVVLFSILIITILLMLQWVMIKSKNSVNTINSKVDLFADIENDPGKVFPSDQNDHTYGEVKKKMELQIPKEYDFKKLYSFRSFCEFPILTKESSTSSSENKLALVSIFASNIYNVYNRENKNNSNYEDSDTDELMFKNSTKSSFNSLAEQQITESFTNFKCLRFELNSIDVPNFQKFLTSLEIRLPSSFKFKKESCGMFPLGWLTPNALIQAYLLGQSYYIENSTLKNVNLFYVNNIRSFLYGLAVETALKLTLPGNNNHFSSDTINFCWPNQKNQISSCECPYLRSLAAAFGRIHSDLFEATQPDLSLVHQDLLQRLQKMNRATETQGSITKALYLTLLEHKANDAKWLPMVHQLFSAHLCASFGVINRISNKTTLFDKQSLDSLICRSVMKQNPLDKSAEDLQDEFDRLSKDGYCIPQEIINWLWKSQTTIDIMYQSSIYFKAYSKLLMYPLLKKIAAIFENATDSANENFPRISLFSGLEETVFYLMHAIGLGETNLKSSLASRLQISQSARINFEIYELLTHPKAPSSRAHLRLFVNDAKINIFGKLCSTKNKIDDPSHSGDCYLSDFIEFLDSYQGYWVGLGLEQYFIDRITPKDFFYSKICQVASRT